MIDAFARDPSWLQRRYDEALADLASIATQLEALLPEPDLRELVDIQQQGLAKDTRHFAALMRQAAGAYRQLAHIARMMVASGVKCEQQPDHPTYVAWRCAQLARLGPQRNVPYGLEVRRAA